MNYESVLVMEASLSKEAQKKIFQKIREIIKQFKGHIHHIDTWGVRKLANKNRKNWSQGLYFHFSFVGESGVVEELVRIIRMDEKLLYYHFEKLSSQKSPEEHLDDFRSLVEEAIKKEKERQARIQKRKSFLSKKVG
ncbi:MAG: 30S ribosomal protein S6 [Oligoflexia bacterium]|nr:30S ribosomal protein S6 [Bdellovibrionales bacterium]MYE07659.1 30S ribosomal protein S6 [Oligoflexia bacterium]